VQKKSFIYLFIFNFFCFFVDESFALLCFVLLFCCVFVFVFVFVFFYLKSLQDYDYRFRRKLWGGEEKKTCLEVWEEDAYRKNDVTNSHILKEYDEDPSNISPISIYGKRQGIQDVETNSNRYETQEGKFSKCFVFLFFFFFLRFRYDLF